ncbi:TPA: DciA family protein [Pseudomonas aeruginosa]
MLFAEAQRICRLQQLLESQLQPAARPYCHVASWRGGCLLLIVTDGHWATRLRYQQRRLQRQLQAFEEFANLAKILFKVQPTTSTQRAARRSLTLSAVAAENLRESAEIVGNPRLREALERLASRAEKSRQVWGGDCFDTCQKRDG